MDGPADLDHFLIGSAAIADPYNGVGSGPDPDPGSPKPALAARLRRLGCGSFRVAHCTDPLRVQNGRFRSLAVPCARPSLISGRLTPVLGRKNRSTERDRLVCSLCKRSTPACATLVCIGRFRFSAHFIRGFRRPSLRDPLENPLHGTLLPAMLRCLVW